MKFNTLRLPAALVKRAAVAAAIDADRSLERAKRKLRRNLKQHEIVLVHREVRQKQNLARRLSKHLREIA